MPQRSQRPKCMTCFLENCQRVTQVQPLLVTMCLKNTQIPRIENLISPARVKCSALHLGPITVARGRYQNWPHLGHMDVLASVTSSRERCWGDTSKPLPTCAQYSLQLTQTTYLGDRHVQCMHSVLSQNRTLIWDIFHTFCNFPTLYFCL